MYAADKILQFIISSYLVMDSELASSYFPCYEVKVWPEKKIASLAL